MRKLLFALVLSCPVAVQAQALPDLVEKVSASVVYLSHEEGKDFGSCAGIVIDAARRQVVTARHCLTDGKEVYLATLQNGAVMKAKVLGRATIDVALLELEGSAPLVPAVPGDARALRAGDSVFAIGHPFGYKWSVTAGIISYVDRDDGDPSGLHLQTDAPINPGNSGGALFNFKGELVGLTDSIYSPPNPFGRSGSVGLGFAIPTHTLFEVIKAFQ